MSTVQAPSSTTCPICNLGVRVFTPVDSTVPVLVNHRRPDNGDTCLGSRVPLANLPQPKTEEPGPVVIRGDGICMPDGRWHHPIKWYDRHQVEHTCCEVDEEEWPCAVYLEHLQFASPEPEHLADREPPRPSNDPVFRLADDIASYWHRLIDQHVPTEVATKLTLAHQQMITKPLLAAMVFTRPVRAAADAMVNGHHTNGKGPDDDANLEG